MNQGLNEGSILKPGERKNPGEDIGNMVREIFRRDDLPTLGNISLLGAFLHENDAASPGSPGRLDDKFPAASECSLQPGPGERVS